MEKFLKDGFLIIRNGIDKILLDKLKNIINNDFRKTSKNKKYDIFLKKILKKKKSNFEFCLDIHNDCLHSEIYKKILSSKKILPKLVKLIGPDLAHHEDPSWTINEYGKNSSKKNYHFKNWHQEIWSGSSTSTLVVWAPIFLPKNKSGQIEFIKSSHRWGHVPHQNRMPISLPKKFKNIKININEGDILIFHSLLFHKTSPIISKKFDARIALITHVKNFKQNDISYNSNKSWRLFNFSELTKIEKVLGNHYLSPYRTMKTS